MKQNITILLFFLTALNTIAQDYRFINYSNDHQGFFLALNAGVNHVDILNEVEDDGNYFYRGLGSIFDLKIGGAVAPNFILHGTYLSYYMQGPEVQYGYETIKASNRIGLGEGLIGGGLTYYIMPSNTFLSASLGLGIFTIDNDIEGYSGSTNIGLGYQLQAGKDWYLSKKWGLGFAFTLGVCDVTNKPEDSAVEKLNSNNWSIMLHATLN